MPDNVLRVLSIDGGGMRGIYASAYLNKLQESHIRGKDPGECLDVGKGFDLIVGTSSGAIMACGLVAGVSISTIAEAFSKFGPKVFLKQVPTSKWRVLLDFCRKKYIEAGEKALLDELEEFLGDKTVGEVWKERKIALAVTAVHLYDHNAWVFKTPHLEGTNHRDDNYRLADICLASTAAPIYRAIANIPSEEKNKDNDSHKKAFIDGGLFANNPVLVALWDALEMNKDKRPIEIYCLGTNPPNGGDTISNGRNNWSYLKWGMGAKVVKVTLRAQQNLFDHIAKTIAKHLSIECSIIRFPSETLAPEQAKHGELDATSDESKKVLRTQAEKDVDSLCSKMKKSSDEDAQKIKALFQSMPTMQREQPSTYERNESHV